MSKSKTKSIDPATEKLLWEAKRVANQAKYDVHRDQVRAVKAAMKVLTDFIDDHAFPGTSGSSL